MARKERHLRRVDGAKEVSSIPCKSDTDLKDGTHTGIEDSLPAYFTQDHRI